MSILTVEVGEDELQSLNALAKYAGAGEDTKVNAESIAHDLLHGGLVATLREYGLPWAPSADQVQQRAAELPSDPTGMERVGAAITLAVPPAASEGSATSTDSAASQKSRLERIRNDKRVRLTVEVCLGAAFGIVLVGGYVLRWQWTGFPSNSQLWDWLNLLLLPIVFATLPLWLQHSQHIDRPRRVAYAFVVVAFAVFVAAGYLGPLGWTGFQGNTLWDWLTLLILPVTALTLQTWPTTGRAIKPRHWLTAATLVIAWFITALGGYLWNWTWTGYTGNTLWDWLQLLLLPLVLPTVLLPATVGFITGNVEKRVAEEKERLERGLADERAKNASAMEGKETAAGTPPPATS